jgi:hypothetical protein
MRDKSDIDYICKLKDADRIFDWICALNYFAGQFNNNCPVDESRRVFERIKELLKESK